MRNSIAKKQMNIKIQLSVFIASTALAVALPWIFHALGRVLGVGTSAGEIFLPMHLPVILAGLIAGPLAGLAAGVASPVLSFMITGMPAALMLPFITLELAVYGITSGLLSNRRMNTTLKVALVQMTGRVIRACAILFAVYALSSKVSPQIIYTSIITGLPGIAIQLLLIPSIVKKVGK